MWRTRWSERSVVVEGSLAESGSAGLQDDAASSVRFGCGWAVGTSPMAGFVRLGAGWTAGNSRTAGVDVRQQRGCRRLQVRFGVGLFSMTAQRQRSGGHRMRR